MKFVAYYELHDEDMVLSVKEERSITKNDVIVFSGNQKACRIYTVRNQNKGKTKVPYLVFNSTFEIGRQGG